MHTGPYSLAHLKHLALAALSSVACDAASLDYLECFGQILIKQKIEPAGVAKSIMRSSRQGCGKWQQCIRQQLGQSILAAYLLRSSSGTAQSKHVVGT